MSSKGSPKAIHTNTPSPLLVLIRLSSILILVTPCFALEPPNLACDHHPNPHRTNQNIPLGEVPSQQQLPRQRKPKRIHPRRPVKLSTLHRHRNQTGSPTRRNRPPTRAQHARNPIDRHRPKRRPTIFGHAPGQTMRPHPHRQPAHHCGNGQPCASQPPPHRARRSLSAFHPARTRRAPHQPTKPAIAINPTTTPLPTQG